jgi:hypothetical protein
MLAHSGASKNCFGGDIQRIGVDMRPAVHARTGEDEHIIQVLDPLDPVQLCRGEPQEVRQMPLALWNVFIFPPHARLHDSDPIALLRGTERGNLPPNPEPMTTTS